MKNKIKEIQDYFIAKMLSNDFEITDTSEHVAEILIDGEYRFGIWLANKPENRIPYHGVHNYFMEVKFTRKQALKMHSLLWRHIADYKKNVLLKEKRKQFEALKKELGEN